ncbi:hypothetical protein [Desulfuribacillus stibiiarsenatis]|nr:hypothetical protein [Desulfuribacillus stibiiarsenatis]
MDKVVVFAIILSASGTIARDIFSSDGELITAISDVIGAVALTLNGLI